MNTKFALKLKHLLLFMWIILICAAIYYYFKYDITVEIVQGYIYSFGLWGALIFILAYTIRPLVFFPTSVMTPAAVILFGPLWGWIIAYVGENFSANFAFWIARYFGRGYVREHEQGFLKKFDHSLSHCGFETVLFLRFVPLFPFDFVNYAAGLSSVRHGSYFWATLFGVIPGLTAFILLGASFASNPWFLVPALIAFAVLAMIGHYLHSRKKGGCEADQSD